METSRRDAQVSREVGEGGGERLKESETQRTETRKRQNQRQGERERRETRHREQGDRVGRRRVAELQTKTERNIEAARRNKKKEAG